MTRALGLAALAAIAGLLLLAYLQQREITRLTGAVNAETISHLQTKGDYHAAQEQAKQKARDALDAAYAENARIDQERSQSYETRIAAVRADYDQRLRGWAQGQAARGGGGGADLPGLPGAAGGADEAPDHRLLLATEQAIQLDELISWIEAHSSPAVRPGEGDAGAEPLAPASSR